MTAEADSNPRIAIVGAGLGGLACARTLQKHHRAVTVFERKRSADFRSPGGTFSVQPGMGQDALRATGLLDSTVLARPDGREVRMFGNDAMLLHRLPPVGGRTGTPDMDCDRLRQLLLDALTEGTVLWGTSVDRVVPLPDGTSRVHFDDRTTEDFDLVIGADGAWSSTRRALSEAVPAYLGRTFVETYINDPEARHHGVVHLIGSGSMVAMAGGKAMTARRLSNGRVRLRAAFRAPEDWHIGLDLSDAGVVLARLVELYDGWDERLLDLLRVNNGGFVNRPLYALPVHRWAHVPGVTLLGDAAHLMPSFDIGANLALLDGADLAEALVTEGGVDEAVRAYEDAMSVRWAANAELATSHF
ncbi:NAD(P)/FAD-dependent oxidoreductase [Streptomyces sp. NPDC053720]|uniref:FAD-dependent oxidoreductase n=1 Tax=Streptomyces sp. NPDC053720 TaxID=3154855 RepID=UPI003440A2C5